MSHTPAPWRVHRLYATCIEAGEDTLITALETRGIVSKPQSEYSIPGITQQEANARLIAAAPELLQILKKCLKDELSRRKKLLNESTSACYADDRIEQMNVAIAKAEGK